MKSMDIGQHFIMGLSGAVLSKEDAAALRELRPAGVILRAHNFEQDTPFPAWTKTLAKLLEAVRTETGRENPIVAIDHEGGRVHRVPAPLTHFPFACEYFACAEEVAKAMAMELSAIGINLSFAPVADIHSKPENPVIGKRAFGNTPMQVAIAAVHFAKSLLLSGVVPVGKHFPGHGDTIQDSHEELPHLDHDLRQLRVRELIPFKALIDAGIPAILTAHILFPLIDSIPATLSHKIITGVLREELGFTGVVITDDLDMKAIALNYREEFIARHAFTAGCDILLFNHEPQRAIAVRKHVEALMEKGVIKREKMEASQARVQHFLGAVLKHHTAGVPAASLLEQNAKLNQSLRV